MSHKGVRPEDILSDDVNALEIDGIQARKGSVAAVLANANILESETASDEEKESAMSIIEELAPTLVAIGLYRHVTWKNKKIQAVFDKVASASHPKSAS